MRWREWWETWMLKWEVTTEITIEPWERKDAVTEITIEPWEVKDGAALTIMKGAYLNSAQLTIWTSEGNSSRTMKSTSSPGAPPVEETRTRLTTWWSMGHEEDCCRMSDSEEELMLAVTTTLSWQPWDPSKGEKSQDRIPSTQNSSRQSQSLQYKFFSHSLQ